MSNNKLKYKQFCEQEKDIPLFLKYSWFENLYVVNEWDVAIAEKGGNVVGILPFVVSNDRKSDV